MVSASTSFNYTDERHPEDSHMFARREQSLWRDQQGSALIEGVVMLPLLIAFFYGVFEFSWFFYQQHLVAIGLHDAASYLARSSDPCNPTSPAWKVALQQAKNLATSGSISAGAARVRGWTAESVTPQCTKIDNPIGTTDHYSIDPEFAFSVLFSGRAHWLSEFTDSCLNHFDSG